MLQQTYENEVELMEIWDGYRRDGTLAGVDLIRGQSIPDGVYHLVCDVLVQHVDGDFLLMQRDLSKAQYGGRYEATAGGSALKGEDPLTCIKRELREETGIAAGAFQHIKQAVFDEHQCICHAFLCVTDCDKNSIVLQDGETMGYKWLTEQQFVEFINSGDMIESQRRWYFDFFVERGYCSK